MKKKTQKRLDDEWTAVLSVWTTNHDRPSCLLINATASCELMCVLLVVSRYRHGFNTFPVPRQGRTNQFIDWPPYIFSNKWDAYAPEQWTKQSST